MALLIIFTNSEILSLSCQMRQDPSKQLGNQMLLGNLQYVVQSLYIPLRLHNFFCF